VSNPRNDLTAVSLSGIDRPQGACLAAFFYPLDTPRHTHLANSWQKPSFSQLNEIMEVNKMEAKRSKTVKRKREEEEDRKENWLLSCQ
jgi:hypothetical protein